jgi:hypothetical protein
MNDHQITDNNTTENEKAVRDTFEAMHKGRDLTRHHLRGTYVKPQIAALWNQHCRTWQAAIQSQVSNTDGWVMLPVEPTQAMHDSWMYGKGPWSERYRAMLSAAQKAKP